MSGQYLVDIEVTHCAAHTPGNPKKDEERVQRIPISIRQKASWKRETYVAAALRIAADGLDHDSIPRGMKAVLDAVAKEVEQEYENLPNARTAALKVIARVATGLGVEWQSPLVGEEE